MQLCLGVFMPGDVIKFLLSAMGEFASIHYFIRLTMDEFLNGESTQWLVRLLMVVEGLFPSIRRHCFPYIRQPQ
jgi:hypothetical protein